MSGLLSRTASNQFCPSLSHPRCYQNSSALPFCLVLITVIHFLLGAPKIWYVNFKMFKIRLPALLVVLSGLTTYYLRSFVLYTGFLSNPAFRTKFFFILFNQWTAKLLPISLISSSCVFRLVNSVRLPILHSFVFHPPSSSLPSALLKSSGRHAFFC